MTQFLRVRASQCQLVIDCDYVQEVAIWHDANPPAEQTLWGDALLKGASLPDMLGLGEERIAAAVVLRDPLSGQAAMLLGVSEVVGLIDLPDDHFRLVLDEHSLSSCTRTAAFSPALDRVLLKLEVAALTSSG